MAAAAEIARFWRREEAGAAMARLTEPCPSGVGSHSA